jgi:membrane associated rhomboid family serine protease
MLRENRRTRNPDSTSQSDPGWPRVAPSRRVADEWALVLTAEGLSPAVVRERRVFLLCVPAHEEERASQILATYALENRRSGPPPAEPVLSGQLFAGAAVSVGLLAFFAVTGPWSDGSIWFERGSADSARILLGEVWRSVTALTLHADLAHVLANAIAGALFLTAVCRSWGQGLGCALVLAAGASGNLVNAWVRGGPHVAVGASTAVFGAVGVLGGVGLVRRRRRGTRGRRSWAPAAAALALLAMLGTAGERVDLGAHLFGLVTGGALGILVALALSRPPGAPLQWSLATASLAALLLCWALALSFWNGDPALPGVEEDRRGPGPLLDGGQAIVVGVEEGTARVAGPDAEAAPRLVAFAAQRIPVHRRSRLLNGANVVDGLAGDGCELRILEGHAAAGRVGLAGEHLPGILDQSDQGLVRVGLGADSHHLDARDPSPVISGVVALAEAESLEPLGIQARQHVLRASGLLLARTDGADLEAGGPGEARLATHGNDPLGSAHEIEPQEDSLTRGRVDLALRETLPDRLAVSPLRVDRDQTPRGVERGAALRKQTQRFG